MLNSWFLILISLPTPRNPSIVTRRGGNVSSVYSASLSASEPTFRNMTLRRHQAVIRRKCTRAVRKVTVSRALTTWIRGTRFILCRLVSALPIHF